MFEIYFLIYPCRNGMCAASALVTPYTWKAVNINYCIIKRLWQGRKELK